MTHTIQELFLKVLNLALITYPTYTHQHKMNEPSLFRAPKG